MKKLMSICAMLLIAAPVVVFRQPVAKPQGYVPQAEFCVGNTTTNVLCSKLPAYIGPDPQLEKALLGYKGLFAGLPQNKDGDVETPFDNMAWQMFVALNWAASEVDQPPSRGLTMPGRRVFQNYRKVSALFHDPNAKTAACPQAIVLPRYFIGSYDNGKPSPNHEESLQASTNLPLIDINGNWTIFERRVNDTEAQYLLAPDNDPTQTLTTMQGQQKFIPNHPNGAQFTASDASQTGKVGSIEIKTAWRIIDPTKGDDPSRYFTQTAVIGVRDKLVKTGQQFCTSVTLGLVGMHIIQRNPQDPKNPQLLPQWIWATFEHVDNAPKAQLPCDVGDSARGCPGPWLNQPSCGAANPQPGIRYSYYRPNSIQGTNIRPKSLRAPTDQPQFYWNRTQPYAKGNTTVETAMPQATRCFSIWQTTDQLNTKWRKALADLKSPFQYYMLIGTQWGANIEHSGTQVLPLDAVPAMLSNITLETYIQTNTKFGSNGGPGSCISCHAVATLPAGSKPKSDFSFLPNLAKPETARNLFQTPK